MTGLITLFSCQSFQHSLCHHQHQLCVVNSNVLKVSSMVVCHRVVGAMLVIAVSLCVMTLGFSLITYVILSVFSSKCAQVDQITHCSH